MIVCMKTSLRKWMQWTMVSMTEMGSLGEISKYSVTVFDQDARLSCVHEKKHVRR